MIRALKGVRGSLLWEVLSYAFREFAIGIEPFVAVLFVVFKVESFFALFVFIFEVEPVVPLVLVVVAVESVVTLFVFFIGAWRLLLEFVVFQRLFPVFAELPQLEVLQLFAQ